jgi:hypothetical protein
MKYSIATVCLFVICFSRALFNPFPHNQKLTEFATIQQSLHKQDAKEDAPFHGLINYIDTKAKRRYLKKLTCKGTLWHVFIRVYRLERQSVMLVFSTQLC